jgi:hypothetical protein
MKLKNLKIGKKILFGFSIPVIPFSAFGVWLQLVTPFASSTKYACLNPEHNPPVFSVRGFCAHALLCSLMPAQNLLAHAKQPVHPVPSLLHTEYSTAISLDSERITSYLGCLQSAA